MTEEATFESILTGLVLLFGGGRKGGWMTSIGFALLYVVETNSITCHHYRTNIMDALAVPSRIEQKKHLRTA